MTNGPARPRIARRAALLGQGALLVACAAGCAGRFSADTEYMAEGFTRASLRGRSVAVVPEPPPAAAPQPPDETARQRRAVVGVARGMREAGARVRVLPPPAAQADARPTRPIFAATHAAPPDADVPRVPPRAAYVLVVRVERAQEYRRYARRPAGPGRGPAVARTGGLRVHLRLALLRAHDQAAVWLATGSGDMWNTESSDVADGPAAGSLADDLRRGNLALYPPPPDVQSITQRLTRRLLAHLPYPTDVQPN